MQAVRLAAAEHERAELRAPPRAARVADDREVLLRAELHLLPLGRPAAGPVRRIRALGDDAFEPLRARRREQRLAVLERGREPHGLDGRVEQLLEQRAPLGERPRVHRLVVEHEQVEHHQDEPARAALQRLEAGVAVLVERADLPVEHGGRRPHRAHRSARDVTEALGEVRCRCGS